MTRMKRKLCKRVVLVLLGFVTFFFRLTASGLTEGLIRVNVKKSGSLATNITEVTEEESDALLKQREGSHDYD